MKYRKKPIVVEAMQYRMMLDLPLLEQWLGDRWIYFNDGPYVTTLEGNMKVTLGDWIIKGMAGEFYPCKPDIFRQTYEAVDDGEEA